MEQLTDNGMRISPFCPNLKSKKAYFLGRAPLEESELLDASNHCWCRRTMQVLGPDGEAARPADCRAGRSCFESIV